MIPDCGKPTNVTRQGFRLVGSEQRPCNEPVGHRGLCVFTPGASRPGVLPGEQPLVGTRPHRAAQRRSEGL